MRKFRSGDIGKHFSECFCFVALFLVLLIVTGPTLMPLIDVLAGISLLGYEFYYIIKILIKGEK